jgi:hypothetical protein
VLVVVGTSVGPDVTIGPGAGMGSGVGVSEGSGAGIGSAVGVLSDRPGISGNGRCVEGCGLNGDNWRCDRPKSDGGAGSTRTVTWALVETALSALIVTVFVQLPGAVARNMTSLTPLVPEPIVPIVSTKPPGVKQPPLTTSVSTTPLAGTAPSLPYPM